MVRWILFSLFFVYARLEQVKHWLCISQTLIGVMGDITAPRLTKKSPSSIDDGLKNIPGDDLLSHDLAIIVSSALESLTSVFGMGTGVTPPV